jgi:hypothetical protein
MRRLEVKKMQCVSNPELGGSFVSLELDDYAVPETMKCRVINIGKKIKPVVFGFDGTPYFNFEVFRKYSQNGRLSDVYIEVEYEPKEIELKENVFNTDDGIESYIVDLKSLHEIINIRRVAYRKKHMKLNEFVWHNLLCFDAYGQTFTISEQVPNEFKIPKVENMTIPYSYYRKMHNKFILYSSYIPGPDEICRECGKKWSLDDLNDYSVDEAEDYKLLYFHKDCRKKYNERTQLEEFQNIFPGVYDLKDLKFVAIKNEYCSCEKCKPWFMVETPDGCVKIGWRKRVISIEWLDSYKDFSEKFEDQNVTKGFGHCGNERFIHAWNIEDAAAYLKRAKDGIK